ncbi:hypothetical protein [Alkalilimnicola sp. S0819]|uniref:hypothetical protein n=1 Tax=Alkalilimnicola sp. S0819 TaxID=2613922 RepID=UPI00126275CA|nr:hypothetical protein [Alkalilimnicola sp. S0819]KAB7622626.1 hypothetical protein F3N43_12210 [Alkalilimnicola sp. S0819]MPQ17397.1 hypothetical protein [Alkalilimnicola sp. S0819]
MSSSEWISMIAMAEFAALVTLVLTILLTRGWRGRRRDRSAADNLVSRVREQRDVRRQELQQVLQEKYGLEGEELQAQTERLMAAERDFYDQFISTYLTRNSEAVSQMDEQLRDVLKPYTELQPEPVSGGDAPERAPGGREPGMDPKRVEELADDIRLYRQTLNRVFAEYTAMFGVHLDASQELTARQILERLESGQLTGEEEGAEDSPSEPGAETRAEEGDTANAEATAMLELDESLFDLPPEDEEKKD